MLKKLKIKDFTLIENLEIDFVSGFQVLTGETGAGKSVIIGAIGLLCGQRGQSELVRTGSEKTILEAEFEINKNNLIDEFLDENNIDQFGSLLILRREINHKGLSRAFINDTPSSLSQLSKLTGILIDLHGQHQHQKLLYVENHGIYLDAFASLEKELDKYKILFKKFLHNKNELIRLHNIKKNSIDQHDLFSFQAAELEKANLDENELEQLKGEKLKLENSEQLYEAANFVSNNLYSSENSVLISVSKALNSLAEVENIDTEFKELATNLGSARVMIEEVGRTAELLKEKIEFNPTRLEEIRNREAEIDWLIKKYQVNSIDELIKHQEKLNAELNRIQNYDEDIHGLEENLKSIQNDLNKLAIDISQVRKNKASILEEKMNKTLTTLGMNNANFSVKITWIEDPEGAVSINDKKYKSSERAADQIEFLVSLNKGEPLKQLQKVASGGEISRIMLAIKSILSDTDDTFTLVFDEIDSGISGKIAQIVGNKFKEIGLSKQLIVITHLPQIASQAISQFAVEKIEFNGRNYIKIKTLNKNERIQEIAKLLGGKNVSAEAIANAKNLLNVSQIY
ncbi:MAG: DNA repair protein RecN [Calditrichia bacterium]|nr:DNA repair protein RecN [Calditrichia bacterium]